MKQVFKDILLNKYHYKLFPKLLPESLAIDLFKDLQFVEYSLEGRPAAYGYLNENGAGVTVDKAYEK
jgi:hypothetical protein